MKRILGCILVVALLMMPVQMALAAPGDIVLFEAGPDGSQTEWIDSGVVIGDTLYLKGNKLFAYKMGQPEPELIYNPEEVERKEGELAWWNLRALVALDDKPMALDSASGSLFEFTKDGPVATGYKIDLTSLPGSTGDTVQDGNLVDGMMMVGGQMIVLARPDENSWDTNQLFIADLASGKLTPLGEKQSRIVALAPYKEGKLLLAVDTSYQSNRISTDENYLLIYALDLQTGKFEGEPYVPFVGYNAIRTMAYDTESDALYMTKGTGLYRAAFGSAPEAVNYLAREFNSNSGAAFLMGGKLVIPSYEGIAICSVDPALMPSRVLKVMGDWESSELLPQFLAQYPDVAVNRIDDGVWDVTSVATMIQGGQAADVFSFNSYNSITDLIDKGYALDLSGDKELMELISQYYPQIQEAVMKDGKLYGFPTGISTGLWSYDAKTFDEYGLTYPETMSDYMDLLVEWDDIQDDYPERILMNFYDQNIKEQLFWSILSTYVSVHQKEDEPLSFDHPDFREPMQKLETLPYKFLTDAEREAQNSGTGITRIYSSEYKESLLETYGSLDNWGGQFPKTLAAPPKLSRDAEPFIEGQISMLMVNPFSENQEAALDYIRFVAKNMRPRNSYPMNPNLSEPVENPWFKQNMESSQKYYDELLAKEVEPSEQREHDAELERMKRYIEVESENERWMISTKSIEAYRALAPLIRVSSSNDSVLWGNNSEEFRKILTRYQQGQLNLDQMIRELDQKAQMIFLETR